MSIVWSVFRDRLRRGLDDAGTAQTWTNDELRDYLNAALERFALHTAQEKSWTFTAGSAAVTTITLPDDLLALGPMWFPDRELISPLRLVPGMRFATATVTTSSLPASYYRWPEGTLNLTRALGAGKTLTLYYWAYWPELVEDAQSIITPRWGLEAMEWYVYNRAMTRPGLQQAMIGQYDTRQDSGNPEHNPLERYARFCMQQYERILAQYPTQDRTGWDSVMT